MADFNCIKELYKSFQTHIQKFPMYEKTKTSRIVTVGSLKKVILSSVKAARKKSPLKTAHKNRACQNHCKFLFMLHFCNICGF